MKLELKTEIKQIKLQILVGIKQDRIDLTWGNMIIDNCNKALTLCGVGKLLPSEEEIGKEIKRKLIEINKDKPCPSQKHDLGFSNGFLDCYDFLK